MIHRMHLTDGSVLTGELAHERIAVQTAYGLLTVPGDQVVRIVPGLDRHTELRQQVEELIMDLGAADFSVREKAERHLLSLGPRVLVLLESAATAEQDMERTRRLKAVIQELRRMADEAVDDPMIEQESQPQLIHADTLEAKRFTIVGKLQAKQLTMATDYGRLTVELGKIDRVEIKRKAPAVQMLTVSVEGQHKAMMSHKKTRVRLTRGDRVVIRAEGKITMSPWGSNAFSIPDGMPNYGWYQHGAGEQIAMGALVGRIGSSGTVFLVGSEKEFVAEKSGELELAFAIQHNYANHNFPGSYKVRIRVEPR
jgi:hypothetical protein